MVFNLTELSILNCDRVKNKMGLKVAARLRKIREEVKVAEIEKLMFYLNMMDIEGEE